MAEPTDEELRSYAIGLQMAEIAKLAAHRTAEEQQADAFADDVRAIIDARSTGRRRLPLGPLRRLARIIGLAALKSIIATSARYQIAERPPSPSAVERRVEEVELMLAERFVRLVFTLTDELGSRESALQDAQDDMHSFIQDFDGLPGIDLKTWAHGSLRTLQRRFDRMVKLVDQRRQYLPNRSLVTLPEQQPIYSLKNTAAKRRPKRRHEVR